MTFPPGAREPARPSCGPARCRSRMLLERAVVRGEVRPALVTDRIAAAPYALLQQEFLRTLKPVPNAVIEELVDTILLPLVRGSAARR